MKERRLAGATHSFRLTREAAALVDQITWPRQRGGKSRTGSDAMEWYFSPRGEHPSYEEILESMAFLQERIKEMGNLAAKKEQSETKTPPWWRRFWRS